MKILSFLKNIFSKHNYQVEPIVEVCDCLSENPVVTVTVGGKSLAMSTTQARSLWGKLGSRLEKITPNQNNRSS